MIKDEYYSWLQSQYQYTRTTVKNYRQQISKIDLDHLEHDLLRIRTTRSDKTFNLAVTALRSLSRFLKEEYPRHELILRIERVESIRSPRSNSHPPYTSEEVQQILDTARGWRKVALMIALYAGLRQQEIQSLDIKDITDGVILVREGKGRKMRHVAIPSKLQEELKRWVQLRELQDSGESLLITNRGTRPQLQSGSVLQVLSKQVGFRVSWHRCRATYATQLYRRSKDVKLVQHQLGHTNSSTTDRYIQRSLQEVSEQIERIGDIYD